MQQGAQRVFLIDNGSQDETVARAEDAGATISERAASDYFDDDLLIALVNGVVARESVSAGADDIWWLHLDCGEFPEGPANLTIKEFLHTLDRQFRVVGGSVLNHLPTPDRRPEYISGYHPLDFMPYCYEQTSGENGCTQRHFKHPLQRFDRDRKFISTGIGAH